MNHDISDTWVWMRQQPFITAAKPWKNSMGFINPTGALAVPSDSHNSIKRAVKKRLLLLI